MMAALFFVVLIAAVHRVDALDGLGGYGSNHRWHWPWTPMIQVSFGGLIWSILP